MSHTTSASARFADSLIGDALTGAAQAAAQETKEPSARCTVCSRPLRIYRATDGIDTWTEYYCPDCDVALAA